MMNPTQLLLIDRGIEHAERGHFRQISIKKICAEVGKSHTLVFHYFDSARAFQDAVMQRAAEVGNAKIVAQGLAERHPAAIGASSEVRGAALKSLMAV